MKVCWYAASTLVASLFASTCSAQMMSSATEESSKVSFEAVQPVLRKHCVRCHNEDQPRGDLSLTSLDKVLAGSSSGPVVVFGKAEESPLYTLTAHLDNPKMPPNKPRIAQSELNLIERWIASGGEVDEPKTLAETNELAVDPTMRKSSSDSIPSETPLSVTFDEGKVLLEELRPLAQPTPIKAIAMHPSEAKAVAAGLHQVVVIDTDRGVTEPTAIAIGQKDVSVLRFSPDGNYLFIGVGIPGESGRVLVVDWTKKQWLPGLGNESDLIQSIDCDPLAKQIAIGTAARTVKTFDRESQKELLTHTKHTDWVMSLAYSPEGILLASGDRFGGIHVWESESGKEFATLRGHTGAVTGLTWSSDGNRLMSASVDGTVRTWDMHKLESQSQWTAHKKGVLGMTMLPDGDLVTAGRDGTICKWSMKSGKKSGEVAISSEAIAIVSAKQKDQEAIQLLASDAAGSLYRIADADIGLGKEATGKPQRIELPLRNLDRKFAVRAPIVPTRASLASVERKTIPSVDQPEALDSVSGSARAQPTLSSSDLEEARRTLASLETSLEQTYRSAEQLEESVARMKQWIALQEAREKQAELRQKPNRK